jgi:Lon protease-like protein
LKSLLPLFPLDVVLFPGTPLPLHIFEPRYRELISECLETRKAFGIVRVKKEEVDEEAGAEEQDTRLADVGCTAEIIAVTKTHPDGRMDIVTEGRERFEVLELNEERSYLQGDVLFFGDEPGDPNPEQTAHAIKLHAEILAIAGAKQSLPEQLQQLSFHLAGSLPLDLDFKQALLEMRSEAERIKAVVTAFEAILPKLRRTVQLRQRAGGNGHAGGGPSH